MQLSYIRSFISHVFHGFAWGRTRRDAKEREQDLAQAVLEFGRMKYQLYRTEITIVDVTELAFRLRETTRAITSTLAALERHGLAERTDFPGLWKLKVTSLDQQSHVVLSAGAIIETILHVSK
jgi:hypothetical protein